MLAPIILFVYNRPWHTRQTVEALLSNDLASESDLYIFADGPKKDTTFECINSISEVRQYIQTIHGFKKIHFEESTENIGLDPSVIAGVSKVLQQNEKAIVLEDDIVTNRHFLRYMNDCLDKYQNDNIYMASGFSCNISFPIWYKKNIYLLHRPSSWGWGIRSTVWEKIEWSKEKILLNNLTQRQINKFNRGGNDLYRMLSSFFQNDIIPWDLRFAYNMYLNDALCIYPRYSFVKNIGFDGTGEHKENNKSDFFTAPSSENYNSNLLPKTIKFNPIIEYSFRQFLKKQ